MIPTAEIIRKIKDGSITEEDLQQFADGITQRAAEEALRRVPQVVDHITKQAFFLRKTSQEFYEKNKDLAPHKNIVVNTIEEMEGRHPGLTYEQLLEKVAPEARKRVQEFGHIDKTNEKLTRPDVRQFDKDLGEI